MAIKVSAKYTGGLLPDIIYTVDPMLVPSRNPFECHAKRFCLSLQSMVPPKRFDIFSSDWGMLKRSRCVQIFLQTKKTLLPRRFDSTTIIITIIGGGDVQYDEACTGVFVFSGTVRATFCKLL